MGKFIITEEEKKNILSKYGIINEATGDWSKFPCVVDLSKRTKNTEQRSMEDGSVFYIINGVSYFNNGRKFVNGKTFNYTCNDAEFKVKPKTIKLNPSEEEQCQLLGDKTWSYAKQKNRWFATKDGVNWYEITNNKKAVAILTDPTKGCKNIKELVAFVPPPVADVDFSQAPIEQQKQVNAAKTNVAPDQDNEERPV